MAKPFANSGDPDQMLHSAASDLGLLCLPITLLGVFRLQLDKLNKSVWQPGDLSKGKDSQENIVKHCFLGTIRNICDNIIMLVF